MTPSYDEPTVVMDLTATEIQQGLVADQHKQPPEDEIPTVKLPALKLPAVRRQR